MAYDRAGIGLSESDGQPPTPEHVAERLHAILDVLGADPPYVLVGHSLGGPYVRAFSGMFPAEIAGLVYVDPLDFTATLSDQLAPFEAIGAGEAGKEALYSEIRQFYATAPSDVQAESKVVDDLWTAGSLPCVTCPRRLSPWPCCLQPGTKSSPSPRPSHSTGVIFGSGSQISQ